MANFQSWAWLGGNLSGPITQANLGGTFVPIANYSENFILVDGNDNGVIGDLDGTTQPAPTDGVIVNGTFQQFQQFTTWTNCTITYTDGTTASIVVHVYQLDNGDLVYRLSDVEGQQVTSAGYALGDIQSIQLGNLSSFSSEFESLNPLNHNDFICFVSGTLIRTASGETPVETISVGQLVATRDSSFLPVRWIGRTLLNNDRLKRSPKLRPIRIRKGALGAGTPNADLLVSPQHRILVRSKIAERLFGCREVLVAAKQLVEVEGIEVDNTLGEFEYVHFLLDDHQIVYSNGAETESLYPGPQALKAVGPDALEEIYGLFPELREASGQNKMKGARRLLNGRDGRKLAFRHAKNARDLIAQ